jgi:16S rRNA (cytosine967-C5)-methyltransferase
LAVLKPFQLLIVKELLDNYKFDQPFHNYFTTQCKMHKNWGSKDRKIYRNTCYAYFRLGFFIKEGTVEQQLKFISENADEISENINAKDIFPWSEWVSDHIDFEAWAKGLLKMRPVYLAVKNGLINQVKEWLSSHKIDYEQTGLILKVKAESKCNELIEKGWAWIMDFASQTAANQIDIQDSDTVWDTCSGAGGKALYLSNKYRYLDLTCSDRRLSVLENLKLRFYTLGFKMPRIELADLKEPFQLKYKYDKIILDVPCTGSGTWGRTPENITGITPEKIDLFCTLQRDIARNVIRNLSEKGCLYYITCSVFKQENEANVAYFVKNFGLKLKSEKYLHGPYDETDILYLAELTFS